MNCPLFPEIEETEKKELERKFEELKNKASKYSKDEKIFQDAQEHWGKYGDLKSWNIMYIQIQKACFNCINKKLCRKIDNKIIESYSHDVTMNILSGLMAKKLRGEFWKIARLSAFVHMPCMAIYEKQQIFEDKILDESAYTFYEDGKETIKETENSFIRDGIIHLRE